MNLPMAEGMRRAAIVAVMRLLRSILRMKKACIAAML